MDSSKSEIGALFWIASNKYARVDDEFHKWLCHTLCNNNEEKTRYFNIQETKVESWKNLQSSLNDKIIRKWYLKTKEALYGYNLFLW